MSLAGHEEQVVAYERAMASYDSRASELTGRVYGPWSVESTFRNAQNRNVFRVKHSRTGVVKGLRGHELMALARECWRNGV